MQIEKDYTIVSRPALDIFGGMEAHSEAPIAHCMVGVPNDTLIGTGRREDCDKPFCRGPSTGSVIQLRECAADPGISRQINRIKGFEFVIVRVFFVIPESHLS